MLAVWCRFERRIQRRWFSHAEHGNRKVSEWMESVFGLQLL